jgi:hypothetical protein
MSWEQTQGWFCYLQRYDDRESNGHEENLPHYGKSAVGSEDVITNVSEV